MKYYIELTEQNFDPRKPCRISHNYSNHPLMQLDELEKLANRLQQQDNGQIKFVNKNTRNESRFDTLTEHPDGQSIENVFANIENPGSWIALYDVEKDPVYKQFIANIMDSIGADSNLNDPSIFFASGYIFISSPPSATPFHIDRENNYLLQIHGKKRVTVWDPADRSVVSEKAVENQIIRGSLIEVIYDKNFIKNSIVNDELGAGEGVYMPSSSPHMTNTETKSIAESDKYSITIGVVFFTKSTRTSAYIYGMNSVLRKLGLNPTAPYKSKLYDLIRFPLAFIITKVLFQYLKINKQVGM